MSMKPMLAHIPTGRSVNDSAGVDQSPPGAWRRVPDHNIGHHELVISPRQVAPIAGLALLLAGCAPTAATPTPGATADTTPSATPTPTPTPAAHTAPEPALDLACADLADPGAIDAALTDAVEPSGQPFADLSAGEGPLAYALPQLGGLNCHWSNGTPEYDDSGATNPDHVALHVLLLTDATADDTNGLGDGEQCHDAGGDGAVTCLREIMLGDRWLNVRAIGVRTDGGSAAALPTAGPLFDAVQSAVTSAADRETSWEPPADTLPIAGRCEQLIDGETLTGIFGTATPLVAGRNMGGWSLEAASWKRLDAMPCQLLFSSADSGVGIVSWLSGGDWAFPSADADAEVVEVDGLQGDDRLMVNCRETMAVQSCSADLAVGHSWVRVTTRAAEQDAPAAYDYEIAPRDSAVAVAEAILARLRA
ncbi:hypothetical protein ACFFGH_31225 [Lysobacter korlensis]|uniref:DUF3558 domain-containing protein n=1 Tax=Lysobacter korlensis TaxID=553636 RepID=A0ABV6RZC6_9GAMM